MSWLWGASTNPQFEELAEKACSPLNLPYPQSDDIVTALEIADMIRSKAVLPKIAMQSLKRRIASKNGRVQMYAIGLVDTCIKNGGDHFLAEIASKEFVDEMAGLIRGQTVSPEVKQMLLQYFQQWALAFQSKPDLSFFVDVYNELKTSGISFPPPPAPLPSHLLETTTAPAWVDSDVCMRCRTAFTFTNRKHHCRNCGLVYDQACSSKTMALPRFGIAEEVRVCESCWVKSGKGKVEGPAPAVPGRTPRSRADVDADLQRAIELSLAESQPGGTNFIGSEPPIAQHNGRARGGATAEDDDEEMRLAIEASLRDMERARPSAPTGLDEPEYKPLPTFDLAPRETETILTFSNTMDQMAAYGERDLRRFPHAQALAEQAYYTGDKLRRNMEEKSTKQQMLMEMQAKLSQAVGLYGQILDGQQAYAARKMQEEQAMRYHLQQQQQQQQQHQGMYYPQQGYPYLAQQGYAPQNGYPQYAPPVHQPVYTPPHQAQPTAPSLYPSMPSQAPNPAFAQQQLYHQRQYHQNPQQAYRESVSSPPPGPQKNGYHPDWAPAAVQGEHPIKYGAPAYVSAPPTSAPSAPQRQPSVSYVSGPTPDVELPSAPPSEAPAPATSGPPPVDMSNHPTSPTIASDPLPVAVGVPSAPPPVDMSSHPTSPTKASDTLPMAVGVPSAPPALSASSQQSSYVEGSAVAGSPSRGYAQAQGQQGQGQGQAQWQPQIYGSPSQPHHQPQLYQPISQQPAQPQPQLTHPTPTPPQPQPQQNQPQYQQTQPQTLPAGVYTAASFPQALPATSFFPDAPHELPKGIEKEEEKEALLIEL